MDDSWQPLSTAPKDGTRFTLLVCGPSGLETEMPDVFYGHKSMRKRPDGTIDDELVLWGKQNFLSSYLTPIGWKPKE